MNIADEIVEYGIALKGEIMKRDQRIKELEEAVRVLQTKQTG